jgi:uncharacterized damage-inducible protein DinB
MDPISFLLSILDQAYGRKTWHGTNLRGSLRRVSAEQAAWRPAPGRHNVWELAVHAAYWKYTVTRRLTGAPRGSFPLTGSDWFPRPEEELTEAAWKADLKLLAECHRRLREAVAGLAPERLDEVPPGGKFAIRDLVLGAANHDLYHAGQIQLLKRLRGASAGIPGS